MGLFRSGINPFGLNNPRVCPTKTGERGRIPEPGEIPGALLMGGGRGAGPLWVPRGSGGGSCMCPPPLTRKTTVGLAVSNSGA